MKTIVPIDLAMLAPESLCACAQAKNKCVMVSRVQDNIIFYFALRTYIAHCKTKNQKYLKTKRRQKGRLIGDRVRASQMYLKTNCILKLKQSTYMQISLFLPILGFVDNLTAHFPLI